MSGDWIKMRCSLQSHPKVVRILSATQSDKFRVIGGLHAVWAVFDAHSVDGILNGYTPELMDHIIGWNGFSRAMESVGWLVWDGHETLVLPEFDDNNSQSAKRRAEDQKRKRDARKNPQFVRDVRGQIADKTRTREEKRREELTTAVLRTDAIASEPLSPDEIIFGYGVPLLTNAGTPEKQARSFLGGLRKQHGDAALIDKLRDCLRAKPLQPVEWLAAALPPKQRGYPQTTVAQHNRVAVEEARKLIFGDGHAPV